MWKLLIGLSAVCALQGVAQASPVISFSPGTPYTTPELASFEATGQGMAGMTVEMCFSGQACTGPLTWASLNAGAFGVSGVGWSLSASPTGDTFSTPFVLEVGPNLTLLSFTVSGLTGGVAFDTVNTTNALQAAALQNGQKSPGSGNGQPFMLETSYSGDINVNYFDRLAIYGTWYGDLYLGMTVNFGQAGFAGGLAGNELRFISDTDLVRDRQQITVLPPNGVPLPGTLALTGLALIALGALTRRRARSA